MSKIYYKNGTARTVSDAEEAARKAAEQAAAEAAAEDDGQPEDIKEGENAAPAEGAPDGQKAKAKQMPPKLSRLPPKKLRRLPRTKILIKIKFSNTSAATLKTK